MFSKLPSPHLADWPRHWNGAVQNAKRDLLYHEVCKNRFKCSMWPQSALWYPVVLSSIFNLFQVFVKHGLSGVVKWILLLWSLNILRCLHYDRPLESRGFGDLQVCKSPERPHLFGCTRRRVLCQNIWQAPKEPPAVGTPARAYHLAPTYICSASMFLAVFVLVVWVSESNVRTTM